MKLLVWSRGRGKSNEDSRQKCEAVSFSFVQELVKQRNLTRKEFGDYIVSGMTEFWFTSSVNQLFEIFDFLFFL